MIHPSTKGRKKYILYVVKAPKRKIHTREAQDGKRTQTARAPTTGPPPTAADMIPLMRYNQPEAIAVSEARYFVQAAMRHFNRDLVTFEIFKEVPVRAAGVCEATQL